MISDQMKGLVASGSAIRAMFEEGAQMAKIFGAENVYDFSIGNPNLPTPEPVKEAMLRLLSKEDPTVLHGYMSNSGYEEVREAVALSLNYKFNTKFSYKNIVMSVGAAGALNVIFKSLLNPKDEMMVFAPYFGEYKNLAISFDADFIAVPADKETFQPNLVDFEKMITPKTKIVILNTPNNPTGVVYTEKNIRKLANILNKKQKKFHTDIYLIADEPYRELVYGDVKVPYVTRYYDNTLVVYSYSKSLSLAGERIGYIVIPDEVADFENISAAVNIATRLLGFINAPSLMQKTIAECVIYQMDMSFYDRNRKLIYEGLVNLGYECIYPEGAFYLWIKSPIEDDKKFVELAKEYHILLVPGTFFGCPGYARISYCVNPKTIESSLPNFRKLINTIKGECCTASGGVLARAANVETR